MQRFFNTAGPCKPDMHYMLPAMARLPGLLPLIAQQPVGWVERSATHQKHSQNARRWPAFSGVLA